MTNTIKNIANNAERAINEPTDYLNEVDKLMYCGKCNTPKQKRFDKPFIENIDTVPIPCHCRALELEQEREERKQMEHFRRVSELRERGLKDKKMSEWNFKNDTTNSENIGKARRYVENFDKAKAENTGLLLWGDVGTGKSFVAGCIANALIEQEIPVAMTNFGFILADMMNLKIDKNEYIKNLNKNSLLIIDDFGMERDTPFALEQIYNVIDSRYTASKPLIVTTNLTFEEMENTAIQTDLRRIYDRVLEMCVPIQFKGESKRTENAKYKLEKLKEILG